ncbi:MAG: ABC transporter ATP-binding protein [Calditrichaeota bacterium]|nr:ABC transporter ATP-binding protein [Calditrichota bacterium]
MIEITNLTKKFSNKIAVNDISLSIGNKQIFGLLGPNAAGKTTLIKMVCGILDSDSGSIRINSKQIKEAVRNIGYVAQYFGQYEELTVWENLSFYASMYDIHDHKRLMELLERYELMRFKDQFSGSLSGGYKRRLALCCALAHDPAVLFLDEPTAGIDPVTRKLLWDDFYRLSAEGKTLFVTTHYMEEAQRCNNLAFISNGNIVAEGNPETIKTALGTALVYSIQIEYIPELHAQLKTLPGVILLNQFGSELRAIVEKDFDPKQIQSVIKNLNGNDEQVLQSEPNLEDVFIALTQGEEE